MSRNRHDRVIGSLPARGTLIVEEEPMPRCPACGGGRIAINLTSAPEATCFDCGARWVQDGSEQRRVRLATVSPPAPRRVASM
jgi:hypothetical protein